MSTGNVYMHMHTSVCCAYVYGHMHVCAYVKFFSDMHHPPCLLFHWVMCIIAKVLREIQPLNGVADYKTTLTQ